MVGLLHGRVGAWDEVAFASILTVILLGFTILFVKSIRRGGAERK
jgi:hypothetical protein